MYYIIKSSLWQNFDEIIAIVSYSKRWFRRCRKSSFVLSNHKKKIIELIYQKLSAVFQYWVNNVVSPCHKLNFFFDKVVFPDKIIEKVRMLQFCSVRTIATGESGNPWLLRTLYCGIRLFFIFNFFILKYVKLRCLVISSRSWI